MPREIWRRQQIAHDGMANGSPLTTHVGHPGQNMGVCDYMLSESDH